MNKSIISRVSDLLDELPPGTTFTSRQVADATFGFGNGYRAVSSITASKVIQRKDDIEIIGRDRFNRILYRKRGYAEC